MKLVHYAAGPIGPIQTVEQAAPRSYFDKPRGLWVSVEGEDGWAEWCRSERFGLERLTHVHDIELHVGATVLRIGNAQGIDRLTRRYGCAPMAYMPDSIGIDWRRVAAEYRGIVIAPYIWSRRLDGGASWYYGWDCASGCIWDADAVASVTLREVVPVPAAEDENEAA